MPQAFNGMKQCCRCTEIKSITEFRKHSRYLDGLEYYCKACTKISYNENKERHNRNDRRYYYANKDKPITSRECKSPEEAREHERERLRKYKQSNKELMKEKYFLYCQTEQGRKNNKLKTRRYRTLKAGLNSSLSKKDIELILMIQNGECACCETEFNANFGYEIDHIIPVSLGGSLQFDNVQLLCRSCNAKKKDKVIMYRPEINFECLSFI